MLIYLIGMPGAGKTTSGLRLAGELKYSFMDLDEEIEKKSGQTIFEIFEDKDEAGFRETEVETLKAISETDKNCVIATGGGTPCFGENMAFMNEKGLTIYLKTSSELLAQRLWRTNLNERPLLIGKNKLELLAYLELTLSVRKTCYEQAGIIFDTGLQQIADLAAYIRKYQQMV